MKQLGIVGLDTSHAVQFTRSLNQQPACAEFADFRIAAAYPYGSLDIPSSRDRIVRYSTEVEALGVQLCDSIPAMLAQVDAVLLETNDGRLHLAQAREIFAAGKPVFIDKPVAANLPEVLAIYRLAELWQVPIFSSSVLRFGPEIAAIRAGQLGEITGCDTFSPCPLELTHADLFWYGIHGVELLVSLMGPDCTRVSRTHTRRCDFLTAVWPDDRIGSYRGRRTEQGDYLSGFGGTVQGSHGIRTVGHLTGYEPLLRAILQFFRDQQPPVSPLETLAIYTLMAAADVSRDRQGAAVWLEEVHAQAEQKANEILDVILADSAR